MVASDIVNVSVSSIYSNDVEKRGAHYLTDGLISAYNFHFYISGEHDPDPWILLALSESWFITR